MWLIELFFLMSLKVGQLFTGGSSDVLEHLYSTVSII